MRREYYCYSKPVQSRLATFDSAWSGLAQWEHTAQVALAELFHLTALFVTWISLISIAWSKNCFFTVEHEISDCAAQILF